MTNIKALGLTLAIVLTGCTATTTIDTIQPDTSVRINEKTSVDLSQKQTYQTTSFGQFKFKAEKEGLEPMYGLVPLKFNSGYLVADIIFFAPAMFFNLREVFPYYQIDVEEREIRYKKRETDQWTIYKPKPEEVEHAKSYFGE